MKKIALAVLAFCLCASLAGALDLGDKALPITPAEWVTGEPADPTSIDNNTFYLVEVWSVTCPPCVRSIPILNDLQERYADQGFKIVSFTSDDINQVKAFLEEHPMEYSSFIDDDGDTYIKYMAADNRNTIPHAFLFDHDGYLVWIGNPLDNLESRVKAVLDGTLNRDIAIAVRDARAQMQTYIDEQNITGMLTTLRRLEALESANDSYYQLHYRILAELGVGSDEDIRELQEAWFRGAENQVDSLINLSMVALEHGHPRNRNPELALQAARRAFEIGGETKLEAGLNLAEVYRQIGRIDLSIAVMRNLAENAAPDEVEILSAIENYYSRLQDLGQSPGIEELPE